MVETQNRRMNVEFFLLSKIYPGDLIYRAADNETLNGKQTVHSIYLVLYQNQSEDVLPHGQFEPQKRPKDKTRKKSLAQQRARYTICDILHTESVHAPLLQCSIQEKWLDEPSPTLLDELYNLDYT